MSDIFNAAVLASVQTPASITADGNSAGVRVRDYKGKGAVILTALNTTGTDPTMAIKLQHSGDLDLIGTVTYAGTGNGTITQVIGGADAITENIVVTFSNATTAAVVGATSGALGTATVGTLFSCANIEFMLKAGGTAFVSGDAFTVPVTARTYADVGVAFTGLTSGASVQKKGVDFDQLKAYLRAVYDIGGTDNPAYTIGITAIGYQDY
jgi:hypothetical protein